MSLKAANSQQWLREFLTIECSRSVHSIVDSESHLHGVDGFFREHTTLPAPKVSAFQDGIECLLYQGGANGHALLTFSTGYMKWDLTRKKCLNYINRMSAKLWFRKNILSDEQTMSYTACGGAIRFSEDRWMDWYGKWIENHNSKHFYRYMRDNVYIGEAAYYFDVERKIYVANIVVYAILWERIWT